MSEKEPKYIIDFDEKTVSLDFDKLINILRKLIPWITLILLGSVAGAYTYIRYTKPIYESSSVLKLDIKNEVSMLGMNTTDEDQSYKTISSEIEILRSRLFFNKVIKELNLDVTVYTRGSVLVDERYKNSPFEVSYEIKNPGIYDIPIHVEILSPREFNLSFSRGGIPISGTFKFGEIAENEFVKLRLSLTPAFNSSFEHEKLYFLLNSDQSIVDYLASNLDVQPLNLNANTIKISFRDKNLFKARDLVNSIDTIYLNYTREEKSKANTQKIGFIDQQLGVTEQKLNDAENYFENFTIENRTSDLDANLNKSISLLNGLDSEQYNLKSRLARLNQIDDSLSSGNEVSLTLTDQQLLPSELQKNIMGINDLITKRYLLSQTYHSNTQAFQNLDNEINFLSARLNKSIDAYIDMLNGEVGFLNRQRQLLDKDFKSIPSKSTEYSKIRRYYNLYEDFYLSLMQKRAEYQLALAGTVTDFKILSVANLPSTPLTPQRWMIYGISLVTSLSFSLFLIGLLYLLNNKINSLEELERGTSFPILGSIPFYTNEKLKESRLIIEKDSRSLISESFRTIRTNLQFLVAKKDGLRITLSSSLSGEGKTFIAINIAAVLALSNKKVILVDLDLRKPKIHRILGDNNDKGVSTILSGQDQVDECVKAAEMNNYFFLSAGPTPPNPAELIMSNEFENMLNYLSSKFDIIILDTPPIGLVTDGVLAMKKSDIQLFILRAEFSHKKFLSNIEKLHMIHHFSNLAIILNAIKSSRNLQYGYGTRHGYYMESTNALKTPYNRTKN